MLYYETVVRILSLLRRLLGKKVVDKLNLKSLAVLQLCMQ